jgi:hypothetical protein
MEAGGLKFKYLIINGLQNESLQKEKKIKGQQFKEKVSELFATRNTN